MKRIAVTIICFLSVLSILPAGVSADVFETIYGLRQAVVIVRDGDEETFARAIEVARKSGAKGILSLPPTMIFGRFPAEVGAADFMGLDVLFATDSEEIDPGLVDLVTLKSARGLLDQDEILSMSRPMTMGPFDDVLLRIPRELQEKTAPKAGSPRQGSPAEIQERGISQNSEFLLGTVLVNLVLPESAGATQSENWTEDEIANVIRDAQLGLSQYQNATHWAPLEFAVNCPTVHRGVPVYMEPIEGSMGTDPFWISEALDYLAEVYDIGFPPDIWAREKAHYFNNVMRNRDANFDGAPDYDWVFTAFVADASVNECWVGGSGYAAYSYLGGPYLVCCYPACGFGTGIDFAHVFIHEMGHTFWALDEYASAGAACTERSGYLNYVNANSYFQGCGAGHSCIMNNAPLTEPLPICQWTMGQIGLADDNNPPNSIPDIYEVYPLVEVTALRGDTTYFGDIVIDLDILQTPVPNENTAFGPGEAIDYAPELIGVDMRINDNPAWEEVPGDWEGRSNWSKGIILQEGLDPGDNTIYFKVKNLVGMVDTGSVDVFFVGIRYYSTTAMAEEENIEIRWQTADEIFGADFEVFREDMTERTPKTRIAVVDGGDLCAGAGTSTGDRNRYCYIDESIMPGHKYMYQVVGSIDVVLNSQPQTFVYESNEMTETAIVPLAGNFVSPTIPNPTDDRGSTFSVDVPRSYYDPSGTTSREIMRAPMAETKTPVIVNIYDVAGRQVRELYNLEVFGGQIITLTWDGINDWGQHVATGVYFMKVTAGESEQVQKVIIIR